MKTQNLYYLLVRYLVFSGLVLFCSLVDAQEIKQNIKGQILDQDSNSPLIGATIVVIGSDPLLGNITDVNGEFRISDVPIGRVTLKVAYLGYEEKIIPNLLVNSSKELILNITMEESFEKLEEVIVNAKKDKSEVLNEMSLVSARSFTVEETKRFAGSFNDPARLASAFAGVTNSAEGNNDIIVRGNSSKGILWRMEGIEIPNPNHFANEGATGGPINALSSNMLSDSDFMSGAFAPEYGNALSGVFDMKLRRGNYDQTEKTIGISTLGIDLAMEGPLGSTNGSYIANYRYSTLDLIDRAGIVDFDGVPKYQDLTYNIYLPINKRHFLSFFGLGGISSINTIAEDEDTEENLDKTQFDSYMGTMGFIHNFIIDNDSYLKSFLSLSKTNSNGYTRLPTDEDNDRFYETFNGDYTKNYVRVGSTFGKKFSARNKVEFGVIFNRIGFNAEQNNYDFELEQMVNELSDKGTTERIQSFGSWKYRITKDLTMTSGLHFNSLTLNNSYSIEPRMAMRWDFARGKAFTFGGGLHSKMETPSVYMWRFENEDGTISQPNRDLKMSKAAHVVFGYDQKLGPNAHLKSEVYYQYLYDVPVEDDPTSTYSLLNETEEYDPRVLTNDGTGRNYGIELTLEQYLNQGFYYLTSASIFNSLYTPKDGVERKTAFANHYIFNFIGGKEFNIGKSYKNKVLFVNAKVSLLGGNRYTPIDLEASIAEGDVVRQEDRPLSARSDDLFIPNLSIGIRRDRPKSTHEFKIDIQNVTNNQAVVQEYYTHANESIEESNQLGMFPTISYTINF
ncbi:MAG: TonB-dependent receptor [Bacteroidota bacterium]